MTEAGRRSPASYLSPRRWPVRWRLAIVSASLTVVILLIFAGVVGKLTQERLEQDFNNQLQAEADELAFTNEIDPTTGTFEVPPGSENTRADPEDLKKVGKPDPARGPIRRLLVGPDAICITSAAGPICNGRRLPPPEPGIILFGELAVATAEITNEDTLSGRGGRVFVQVGRDHHELDATIGRLWFFLAVGVVAGGFLAMFVGLAVAGRAMRPIAALTATAQKIATTRDPTRTMPKLEADDEVTELARTLDQMLHELDLARTEAQNMVKTQREFIADASHELRTPLTSILANLELLQHAFENDPREGEESEMVASAIRSSQRMRRLVGDLLILARADAGRQAARRPCDLGAIANAAVAEIHPVAPAHKINAITEATSLDGNPDELHRMALNLIENGVRHTPSGTTITVRAFEREGKAVLEVADDGPGIPDELTSQVFGRFVRGSGPADVATESGPGAGLGLSIVRAVAESHGGTVEVRRSNHGGALFEVTLPSLKPAVKSGPKKLSRVL
jgi:two-component system, OmpR family, sensor kinase